MRSLGAAGVPAETLLPFSGPHEFLQPILPLASGLPTRQRQALLGAFGMSDEATPELFMVVLATLNLITEHAQNTPVLMGLEDAQRPDETSSTVLVLVARRLAAEPAAMLITLRDEHDSPFARAGLPELPLEVDETASAGLLDERIRAGTSLMSTGARRGSRQPPGPGRTASGPARQAHPGRSAPELATATDRSAAAGIRVQASQLPGPTRSLLLVAAATAAAASQSRSRPPPLSKVQTSGRTC